LDRKIAFFRPKVSCQEKRIWLYLCQIDLLPSK
jgi:hypothetical protein